MHIEAPSAGRDVDYVVCNDAATLAWIGNQAALELHPAPVRTDRLDRPDLLVVDVDLPTTRSTPPWRSCASCWRCWAITGSRAA